MPGQLTRWTSMDMIPPAKVYISILIGEINQIKGDSHLSLHCCPWCYDLCAESLTIYFYFSSSSLCFKGFSLQQPEVLFLIVSAGVQMKLRNFLTLATLAARLVLICFFFSWAHLQKIAIYAAAVRRSCFVYWRDNFYLVTKGFYARRDKSGWCREMLWWTSSKKLLGGQVIFLNFQPLSQGISAVIS